MPSLGVGRLVSPVGVKVRGEGGHSSCAGGGSRAGSSGEPSSQKNAQVTVMPVRRKGREREKEAGVCAQVTGSSRSEDGVQADR